MYDENGVEIRIGDHAIGVTGNENDAVIYEGEVVQLNHARMQAKLIIVGSNRDVWLDHDRMAVQLEDANDDRWYEELNEDKWVEWLLDSSDDRSMFRDPGGRSALRAGDPIHPCPTCGRKNQLTDEDVRLGYQCDHCADALEGRYPSEY